MKPHCLVVSVLFACLPTFGSAEESGALTGAFTQLEKAFATAYKEKNTAALEDLLAPEYALIVSARPDRPISRSEWLALIPSYNVRQFEA